MNSSKCTMTAGVSPDFERMFVIGGFNGVQLNEIEQYDPQTQKFVSFKPGMTQKRFMHCSVIVKH